MTRVIPLALVLALLAAGCGSETRLDADALARQARTLRSIAAEGAMLAADAAGGKSTRIYTREHASSLHGRAAKVEARLSGAQAGTALEGRLRRLSALAVEVSGSLGRLGSASGPAQRGLGRRLELAAAESERIGEKLP